MAQIRNMRTEDHNDFLNHVLTQDTKNLLYQPEATVYTRAIENNIIHIQRTKVVCINSCSQQCNKLQSNRRSSAPR